MRIKKTDITLTRKDAVFGRGRKRDNVRKGSLYRQLIEKYWKRYSDLDTTKNGMREVFVKKNILDALVSEGGRFIVRSGAELSLLNLKDKGDRQLILKKVRRALFNEKKRQETKLNCKFVSKKLSFDMEEDAGDDDDDLEDSIEPVSESTGDEDNGMEAVSEQDDDDLESEEEDREMISFGITTSSARSVSPISKAKRVSISPEEEWDFKLVQRARMMMDTTIVPPNNVEGPCGDFDAQDYSTMTDDENAVIEVNEYTRHRSSVKLDQLAKLACSLLFSEDHDDEENKSMPLLVDQKAKKPVAIKEVGLFGNKRLVTNGQEDKKLALIADDWEYLDKQQDAFVKKNVIVLKKPDPPVLGYVVDSSDVAFTVVDSSKPLKKRAYNNYRPIMAGMMGHHNSFRMKRCRLEPRIADFDHDSEEHFFGGAL